MFPLLHPYTIHLPLNTLFSSQKIYQIPHSVLWWIRFLNTVLQGYARKWHCLGFLVQSNRKTRGSTVLAGKQGKQVQKMNRVVRSLDGQDNRPDPAGGWGHPSCPTGREVHGSKSLLICFLSWWPIPWCKLGFKNPLTWLRCCLFLPLGLLVFILHT